MLTILDPASADQVMDTILRKCVELHSKRAQVPGDKSWIPVKARKYNSEVKKYAEDIVVSDFRDAVRKLNEEGGHFAYKAIQILYNEALYWDIIQKQADVLDPLRLRATKGPSDGSGDAEREAAKEFSTALGLRGFSPTSQQKYRRLWKNLANWRKAGVKMILFYRTTQFDNFCEKYSEEAKTPLDKKVLSLEDKYCPHIQQLEHQVMKEARGDMTGRIWLQEPFIMERIKVPEKSWNNVNNPWLVSTNRVQGHFRRRMATKMAKIQTNLSSSPSFPGPRSSFMSVPLSPSIKGTIWGFSREIFDIRMPSTKSMAFVDQRRTFG